MTHPREVSAIAPEIHPPVRAKVSYIGSCDTCAWFGPERPSDLTALRDFDRHALRASHVLKTIEATSAPDDEEAE